MKLNAQWLSLLILLLGVAGAALLQIPVFWRGVIGVVAALLAYIARYQIGMRLSVIEAGRYPRLDQKAASRIADRIRAETPQTLTISAESGNDIDAVLILLKEALELAKWDIRDISSGTLWDGGKGIQVYYAERATSAGKALVEALKAEKLPVREAGETTDGLPVRIVIRHP